MATKKDEQIKFAEDTLKDLYLNRAKLYKLEEIAGLDKQIKDNEEFVNKLMTEKRGLVGETVEGAAKRESDLVLIRKSIYKDQNCTIPVYTPEEFDELDNETINQLFGLFNNYLDELNESNLKNITIQPFFTNIFSMTQNPMEFFGANKGAVYLTHYQSKLLLYGSYMRRILELSPPDSVRDDAEKLETWNSRRRNVEQMLNNVHRR